MKKCRAAPSGAIKIELGIPIPPPRGTPRNTKYPFDNMKVGDSFFIAGGNPRNNRGVYPVAKTRGMKICTRSMDGGLRVWRVA